MKAVNESGLIKKHAGNKIAVIIKTRFTMLLINIVTVMTLSIMVCI